MKKYKYSLHVTEVIEEERNIFTVSVDSLHKIIDMAEETKQWPYHRKWTRKTSLKTNYFN